MFNPMAFQQFMNQMKGQNPNQIINNLVQSGKVSPPQLNQAQQQAQQMEKQLADMRKMFGF